MHADTISSERHLNESNLHLSRYRILAFAKNFSKYLLELNWWPSDNSSSFESKYGKNLQVGTRNTQYNISDINNISMNENVCENEVSVLSTHESDTNQVQNSSETFLDLFTILKEVCKKKF